MCSRCTNHKVSLPFESSPKPLRVCTDCYGQVVIASASKQPTASAPSANSSAGRSALVGTSEGKAEHSPVSSPELSRSPPSLRTGLLEVPHDSAFSFIFIRILEFFDQIRICFLNVQVPVETTSVLSGYLSLKTRGKTWTKRWFALRSDFVLYSYKTHQGERRAMTATPVPGFTVSLVHGAQNASAASLPSSASASSAVECKHDLF